MVDETERSFKGLGRWVVFLGMDGSGKSTLLRNIAQQPPEWCSGVVVRHLVPVLFRRHSEAITDPHAQPPRGLLMSLAKLVYWLMAYTVGYWLSVRPQLSRGRLVLFDRYLLDALADPRRYRYGGPAILLRLLWRLVPKPSAVVLLEAPVDVLTARKQEVGLEEMARQHEAYRRLISKEQRGLIVDASGTAEEVLEAVRELLMLDGEKLRLELRMSHG